MNIEKAGGTAYPFTEHHQDGSFYNDSPGMSLRDYFAAKVLAAVYDAYLREVDLGPNWKTGVAMDAYSMADAMLEVRQK